MTRPLFIALMWFAVLALPAAAAVSKDGGEKAVNPCLDNPSSCAAEAPRAEPAVTEPMVIYLDAEGKELVRLPLSRFRDEIPDKLPPDLQLDR